MEKPGCYNTIASVIQNSGRDENYVRNLFVQQDPKRLYIFEAIRINEGRSWPYGHDQLFRDAAQRAETNGCTVSFHDFEIHDFESIAWYLGYRFRLFFNEDFDEGNISKYLI